MPKIVIKGTKKYVKYLASHLKKEHPSTKKRMEVKNMKMHSHYVVGAHGKKTMSSHPYSRKHMNKKTQRYHYAAMKKKGYYK